MPLNCHVNENPRPQALARQVNVRTLGLSSVFELTTDVSVCREAYTSPSYTIDGACCGPLTASTATTINTVISGCTYNLSEQNTIDLQFNFTGSTQYTGYTGEFCYTLTEITDLTNRPPANFGARCFSYDTITGGTLSDTLTLAELLVSDREYNITSWNKFRPSVCVTGITIDTSKYPGHDTSKDCYLTTITNPPKPILADANPVPFDDISFVNESLRPVLVDGTRQAELRFRPIGSAVVVAVNGVVMNNKDYTVFDRIVTFNVELESRDNISAFYNKTTSSNLGEISLRNSLLELEMFSVTGITSGVTATTINQVNWNPDKARLEVFTTRGIDSSIDPLVMVNGVVLSYRYDIYPSSSTSNKLIFSENATIENGDIITIYYFAPTAIDAGDLGTLLTDTPNISWTIPSYLDEITTNGVFTVQVTNDTDTTYSSIVASATTVYDNTLNYDLDITIVGPSTGVSNYIYRVIFDKTYSNTVASHTTQTISDNGSFSIDNSYISNTY